MRTTSRSRRCSSFIQVAPRRGAPEDGVRHFVDVGNPRPWGRELLNAGPVRQGGGKVGQSSEVSQVRQGELLLLDYGEAGQAKLGRDGVGRGAGVDAGHAGGIGRRQAGEGPRGRRAGISAMAWVLDGGPGRRSGCLLYTSDAADE